MQRIDEDWESRMSALWATIDQIEPDAFVARVDAMAAELPNGDGTALFERGAARDSTGRTEEAVRFYRYALAAGLTGLRRRRANIQMASSLRVLGRVEEAFALLDTELHATSDELDDAVRAFLALVLVDLGREREAVSVSLIALSRHLARYNRSLERYARQLTAA